MHEMVRLGLRMIAVCVVVLVCGGVACTKPLGDIGYAPGHGYVVKVQKTVSFFEVRYDYYVFDTQEQAEQFVARRYSDGTWPANSGARYVWENQNDQIEYDKITKVLVPLPLPPALNETGIPLATPDLPQPIPQAPL